MIKKKLQPNEQKLLTHSLHTETSVRSRNMLQIRAQSSIEKIIKDSLAKEQTDTLKFEQRNYETLNFEHLTNICRLERTGMFPFLWLWKKGDNIIFSGSYLNIVRGCTGHVEVKR